MPARRFLFARETRHPSGGGHQSISTSQPSELPKLAAIGILSVGAVPLPET